MGIGAAGLFGRVTQAVVVVVCASGTRVFPAHAVDWAEVEFGAVANGVAVHVGAPVQGCGSGSANIPRDFRTKIVGADTREGQGVACGVGQQQPPAEIADAVGIEIERAQTAPS